MIFNFEIQFIVTITRIFPGVEGKGENLGSPEKNLIASHTGCGRGHTLKVTLGASPASRLGSVGAESKWASLLSAVGQTAKPSPLPA